MAGTNGRPKKEEDFTAFLESLRETGLVYEACKEAGIGKSTVYRKLASDPNFKTAYEAAVDDSTQSLEAEAIRRAKDGSDTLLIFMLKARRPATYRDNLVSIELLDRLEALEQRAQEHGHST